MIGLIEFLLSLFFPNHGDFLHIHRIRAYKDIEFPGIPAILQVGIIIFKFVGGHVEAHSPGLAGSLM